MIIPLGAGAAAPADSLSEQSSVLTALENAEIAKLKKDERHYWQDDDPLKNFPAARARLLSCATRETAGVARRLPIVFAKGSAAAWTTREL